MSKNYASKLTKQELIENGITEITKDARIFRGEREIFPHWIPGKRPYLGLTLYDLDENGNKIKVPTTRIFKGCNKPTDTYLYKLRTIGLHRIMWAWHYGEVPEGMICDHIDNKHETLYDYRLDNLQLLTPKMNVNKEKTNWHTKEIKCKINKPRSFYEDKLTKYEALHEEAKKNKDAKAAHKLRGQISQTRARLRYYDSHKEEVHKMTEFQKDLIELKAYKKSFKEQNNKSMWHECCKVEKIVKEKKENAAIILKHALEVLDKHFK